MKLRGFDNMKNLKVCHKVKSVKKIKAKWNCVYCC